MEPSRGDIYFADLNPVLGSEQGGFRPVLIVQNDIGNKYSPTDKESAISSQIQKAKLPTHVELPASVKKKKKDSVILLEQIRSIDKRRLKKCVARLDKDIMDRVDESLSISLGLKEI